MSDPETIKIKHRGKEIEMPLDKAIALASKGFDYESKMSDLKRQQSELEADGIRYGHYLKFKSQIDSDPTLNSAVQAAIADPHRVLRRAEAPVRSAEEDDELPVEHARGESDPAVLAELRALKTELAKTQERVARGDSERMQRTAEAALEKELKSYPWLEGQTADLARQTIRGRLAQDPTQPLDAVVGEVATQFKDALEAVQGERRANAEARQELSTEKPGEGTPSPITAPKYTRKDLEDGTVLEAATKRLKALEAKAREAGADMFKID